ncbi:NADP-specific glutamate dehydrogenase [Winogradskyella undariae]|uniref:NADP-specific glutamate dehydrogenase n=1 Tax=Winogradskyella undariae TaxID=1285465 RepID=UPI0015C939CD|nr:NADP-specific glutamate dehydrogenase [Winogradskyella undariae]QNK77051.1 NADP-specific glutamate dehydrogenase [Winogradskyella sp. PAMC22761]
MIKKVENFLAEVQARNSHEPEFLQAVHEVAESLIPYISDNEIYKGKNILLRMVEPERLISFRVSWVNDKGEIQVNRGYRIQMNSAIGPYKGGLRFHPSVNASILKFLAFEQVFKNALTTLPMGGGKGGADFDPKGKSDAEIMRFCQAFMSELYRHIGPNTDVPAGDIGVGGREIGYMFGTYKKLKNEFTGILTGKGPTWGGSLMRPESTGYGVVYFTQNMLKLKKETLEGKSIVMSGSGNVAQFAAEKAIELGAKVLTLSDSGGYILDEEGIDTEKLSYIKELKNVKRGRISDYVEEFPKAKYFVGERPWSVKCDIALPCATQNELNGDEAKQLVSHGCICVVEGANMPSTPEAIQVFQEAKLLFAPGKASNAGGVATSGLEMSQNSLRLSWSKEEVDTRLKAIMEAIHQSCVSYGENKDGSIDYIKGANIAAFVKIADAMLAQGVV